MSVSGSTRPPEGWSTRAQAGASPHRKPRLFIGSSKEGQRFAEAVQLELGEAVDATGWWQGFFPLGESTLESLERSLQHFDVAVLLATTDDLLEMRGHAGPVPRDNVVFEIGLCVGVLGRHRTFIIRQDGTVLPSDLSGITIGSFVPRADSDQAAVGPACSRVKAALRRIFDAAPGSPHLIVPRRRRRRSLGVARVTGPEPSHQIVNISTSGALLETSRALDIGVNLDLDLELDDRTVINVGAQVVRVQRPDWGRIGGVGVRFTRIDETTRRTLEHYVDADPRAY